MSELRDKTVDLRRQHIMDAALRVFAERGFHRTTIRDIARAAGVSDGTIYNVFENKDALLLSFLRPLNEDSALVLPSGMPPQDLDALLGQMVKRRWAAFTPETLSMLRVVLSEVLVNRELRSRYLELVIAPALVGTEPLFRALIDDGRIRKVNVPMSARLLVASFLGLVMLRLLGDEELEQSVGSVPDALTDLLLDGLRPKKPSEG